MTDFVELAIFSSRIEAVCDEMGVALMRSAFSANIKDRLDFSCAVFDVRGELCAQAAHIPVHLGSMAYTMKDIVAGTEWQEGDVVVFNDPFLGGTHLPDVTLISPVYVAGVLVGFVANRAHHANIGSDSPGSMPVSRNIEEEGVIIPPQKLFAGGLRNESCFDLLARIEPPESCHLGLPLDFWAQISANKVGAERLAGLVRSLGICRYEQMKTELFNYAERLAQQFVRQLMPGEFQFKDTMEGDGISEAEFTISLCLKISSRGLYFNFSGTSPQAAGNINCPLSVTAAAVYYVLKCLMPPETPTCAGAFSFASIEAPRRSLVNAQSPAAVAAGNVETSSRIVDVVLGAFAQVLPEQIPAASQGTMNNVAMGSRCAGRYWDYYETIGGGMGANPRGAGLSAVQTHMTNTLNTPIESVELNYPLRIRRYALARETGGAGVHPGGDGLIREYEFTSSAQVSLLSERRRIPPYGLKNGQPGRLGRNLLNNRPLSAKKSFKVHAGDLLTIYTPGGGGWGETS